MKTLLSQPAEVIDLVEAYSVPSGTGNRPFVRCNMISTLDGAITINCLSGLLGGSADRASFKWCDRWRTSFLGVTSSL